MISNSRRTLPLILLTAIAIGFFTHLAQAQQNQTENWLPKYMLATGKPTFAAPEPVPLGFVNVANGNLHIEIPFATIPQRAGPPLVVKMIYDSLIWRVIATGGANVWVPDNAGPFGGWRFMTSAGGSAANDAVISYSPSYSYHASNYRYYDTDGTIRRFPITVNSPGTSTTSGPSLDATGYWMDAGTNPPKVTSSGGTRLSWVDDINGNTTNTWKDTNGNFITQAVSSTQWFLNGGSFSSPKANGNATDTLNRPVVQATTQPYFASPNDYGPSGYITTYAIPNSYYYSGASSSCNGTSSLCGLGTGFTNFTVSYTATTTEDPVSPCTAFGLYVTENCTGPSGMVQSIQMPDGSTYQFGYENNYGLLNSITLPTGGTVSITYTNFYEAFGFYGSASRWVNKVAAGGGTWTFGPRNANNQITVTRPSGDETVYTFWFDTQHDGAWNTLTKYYTGIAINSQVALTVQHDYTCVSDSTTCLTNPSTGSNGAFIRPTRTITTSPAPGGVNLVSKTEDDYEPTFSYAGTTYQGARSNVVAHREFAYGSGAPGALLRQQCFSYLHYANPSCNSNTNPSPNAASAYVGTNIVNRVTDVQTKDAAGNLKAETMTTYDSTPLTAVTGITHHDDTNFGSGNTLRGNPTSVQSWTGSSYLSTINTYDTTGEVLSTSDPKGAVTQFSYVNNFYQDNQASYWPAQPGPTPPLPYTAPVATNAFVTQKTLPLSGTIRYGYMYGRGEQAAVTDQNNQTTYQHYGDAYDRPTFGNLPTGAWVRGAYPSPNQQNYSLSTGLTTTVMLDSLGRVSEQQVTTSGAKTDRSYDTSGRVSSVTNPYYQCGNLPPGGQPDATCGSTGYRYDSLNRVTQTFHDSYNSISTYYGSSVGTGGGISAQLCASATYGLGYPVLSKDEVGKKRQGWTDALGRLIEADEPDSTGALTLGTCYQYDVLGNLTNVVQGSQTRTFTYDALSRLVIETTPEAGTVNYFYTTAGGGLCAGDPRALCRTTDARGITSTYAYDAENRLTGKTYSNGEPAVSYFGVPGRPITTIRACTPRRSRTAP